MDDLVPTGSRKEHEALKRQYVGLAHTYGAHRDVDTVFALLAPLAQHHLGTASHCLRVGISAGNITKHLGEDAALALTAGAIHDIGKVGVPQRLLGSQTIDGYDFYRYMVPHVDIGYRMSVELLPRPAECMKNHHRHQGDRSYGLLSPDAGHRYTKEQKTEHWRMSRLIALADYVDAILTRNNDKFGDHPPTRAERREALYRDQADMAQELDALLHNHIIDLREYPRTSAQDRS